VTWQGQLLYEIGKLTATEIAASSITREIIAVAVCDQAGCGGSCGTATDGCQKVFMVSVSAGGSPGLTPDVVYTSNGFSTIGVSHINSLALTESPDDAACVGDNLVVVSGGAGASDSLHYAAITDILAGSTNIWTEVTTGFVASKGPQAIWSIGPNETWMAGAGGYIYFTSDPTGGVSVQDAGVATSQDLNDIHILDSTHGVAVGASNAVVRTTDGSTWGAKTGPAVGIALNAVWMKSADIWLVGTAGGALYYTADGGTSWTAIGLGGSPAVIDDIYFVNQTVGYVAFHTSAPAGKIYRTIDGGHSWYALPESGSMPANDKVNALRACAVNTVYGGGLADNGTDGFGVKLAA